MKKLLSNIKDFIVRGYYFYFLLIVCIYIVLFGWKHSIVARYTHAMVSGRILDVSEDTPVELVKITEGGQFSYSNYLGQFTLLEDGVAMPNLKVEIPRNYEQDFQKLKCAQISTGILDKSYFCDVSLHPQAFEMAYRILNGEFPVEFNMRNERKARKDGIWRRSYVDSRTAFGREEDFVNLLMYKEEIEIKLKDRLVSYYVDENYKMLGAYFDKLTEKEFKSVAEISVKRTFESGKSTTTLEHFVRENGVWRYLIPYSYWDLKNFVDYNKWVLLKE